MDTTFDEMVDQTFERCDVECLVVLEGSNERRNNAIKWLGQISIHSVYLFCFLMQMMTYLGGPVSTNGRTESVDAKRSSHFAVVLVIIDEECLFGHIA